MPKGLHHVAYRCADADATIDFYTRLVGMPFAHALFNDRVPSTQELSPHLHIFFEMEDGSYLAFFELPLAPPQSMDPNTPDWVQHLALEVADDEALLSTKARLEGAGVEVVGPTDHGFCKSIYFFDPSGHRMELSVRHDSPEAIERFRAEAPAVLAQWHERKQRGWAN
ncbi:MAG: VOC family protein [Rhodopila sp.]|nr:VOC family protein [Rhodopila sp.]